MCPARTRLRAENRYLTAEERSMRTGYLYGRNTRVVRFVNYYVRMSANKEVERFRRVAELAAALDEAHKEFRIVYRRYRDASARRSEIAAQLVENGASISDISRMVGVSKAAV